MEWILADTETLILIEKILGTVVFTIVAFFSTQMFIKLLSPKPKTFYGSTRTRKKLDIIIPAVNINLAIKNTRHLLKCNNVGKIIIVSPSREGKDGKYIFVKDGGKGRANAINMGIDCIESPYVLILDEDLFVPISTIRRGILVLEKYDIVKLTLLPRHRYTDIFRRLIRIERLFVETEVIPKSVAHFGGTGFFRSDVLKDLKFNNAFLTEDIDLTVRAYKKGYSIVSLPDLYAYEEYPSFKGWLIQRRRWAYGWFQVVRHYIREMKNRKVFGFLYTQLFNFIPILLVPSIFFGNLLPDYASIFLSIYCILPIILTGIKFDKKLSLLYVVYYFFLIFYSSICSFIPLRRYVITPKEGSQ